MSWLHKLTYKEDYDELMEYLRSEESSHAPAFDIAKAPKDLQDLYRVVQEPFSDERTAYLTAFSERCWSIPDGEAEVMLPPDYLNKLHYVNRVLRAANAKLRPDGFLFVSFDTSAQRRVLIYSIYPRFFAGIIYFFDYLWHRVCPKLRFTKRFYFKCTKGVRKVFPRPEVLGRLSYCGFDILSETYIHDRYCVIAQKKREPYMTPHSYGPIIKLNRVGKDGKMFWVYKFRTMYAYSEFLQDYVYKCNSIDAGGKFKDDYRVTGWGAFMRKVWLDELPMIGNVLKGQMKLVGVRPLSKHYFGLYSPEMQQLRVMVKPGLLPPFYVDMPETLDEIQESERRYCEAYLQHPFRTDWKYFWKIIGNIVFRHERSK